MPALGVTATWGRQDWSATLIEALTAESALLRSGATRVIVQGRTAHIPRVLVDPSAAWSAELAELPSNAGSADVLVLTPKKLGNVVNLSRESIEDAAVDELDAVGRSMIRGVASQLDSRFFSALAATATEPAGIRSYVLPTGAVVTISVEALIRAVGNIEALGGRPDTIFINPADLIDLRISATSSAYTGSAISIEGPGVASVAGATLIAAPALPAGIALICEARYIVVGIRRDIAVDFSEHSAFSKDAVTARVTARVDWAPSDLNAFHLLT